MCQVESRESRVESHSPPPFLDLLAVMIIAALSCLALFGCDDVTIGDPSPNPGCNDNFCPRRPRPVNEQPPLRTTLSVEIPRELRERNYAGGSCVHASTETLLRHQGYYELAAWWRTTYSGGEYAEGLESKLEAAGLRWASTRNGDPAFLDWADRTRRAAVIFFKPQHSINFVEYESRGDVAYAKLLDNNHPDRYEFVERQQFLREWRGYGGFAATVVGSPPPPDLWRRN